MKKVLILFVLGLAILFSGCAKNPGMPVVKDKSEKGVITIESSFDVVDKTKNIIPLSILDEFMLHEALKMAAEQTLLTNNENFVILNGNVNNLQGSPIINYKDLKDYCLSSKDKTSAFYTSKTYRKCEKISYNIDTIAIELKILPISKTASEQVYSWNAKEVLKDLN